MVPDNAELVAEAAYVTATDGTLLLVEAYAVPRYSGSRPAAARRQTVSWIRRRRAAGCRSFPCAVQTAQDYYPFEQPDVVFGMLKSWRLVKAVPAGAPVPRLFLTKELQGGGEADDSDSREKNMEETVLRQPAFWYYRIRGGQLNAGMDVCGENGKLVKLALKAEAPKGEFEEIRQMTRSLKEIYKGEDVQ